MSNIRIDMQLDGLWQEARETFKDLGPKVDQAVRAAVLQEAQDLRKRIVMQFRNGAPIGGSWKPLSLWTLRSRKASGFGGSKILVRSGDLRNSISILSPAPGTVFVGISRTAVAGNAGGGKATASSVGKRKVQAKKKGPKAVKPMSLKQFHKAAARWAKNQQRLHAKASKEKERSALAKRKGSKARAFSAITLDKLKRKADRENRRSAARSRNPLLINIGMVHEFGASMKVTVTRKMQRYVLGVLMKQGGGAISRAAKAAGQGPVRGKGGRFQKGARSGGGGTGKFRLGATIKITIPPRPFIRPAIEGFDFEKAIAVKVAVNLEKMGKKLGKP